MIGLTPYPFLSPYYGRSPWKWSRGPAKASRGGPRGSSRSRGVNDTWRRADAPLPLSTASRVSTTAPIRRMASRRAATLRITARVTRRTEMEASRARRRCRAYRPTACRASCPARRRPPTAMSLGRRPTLPRRCRTSSSRTPLLRLPRPRCQVLLRHTALAVHPLMNFTTNREPNLSSRREPQSSFDHKK